MATRHCPGCGADLSSTHRSRKWCSERCRKAQYAGSCKLCGAPTSGHNGRANAPAHCETCAPEANAKWSREQIIEKINDWAGLYGSPPSASDWNPAMAEGQGFPNAGTIRKRFEAGDWPWYASVVYYWPTWNDAIAEAGFTPRPQGLRRGFSRAAERGKR